MKTGKYNYYCHPLYFSTKVAMIDDDAGYLEQASLLLDSNIACETFYSLDYALECIAPSIKANKELADKCTAPFERSDMIGSATTLQKLINNPDRFNHFSVVIIDYAMPEMSGIEFCEKIQCPYIKKILLTGVATTDVAVEAFNAGLIDHFIKKESADLDIELNKAVRTLQNLYFKDISAVKNFGLTHEAPFLFDETFAAWFVRLCDEQKVVEYYLWGDFYVKGFLLITGGGELKVLFVSSSARQQQQTDMAERMGASKELIEGLKSGRFIPHFSANGFYDPIYLHNWRERVYESQNIGQYLCALVDTENLRGFNISLIEQNYHQYLENLYSLSD